MDCSTEAFLGLHYLREFAQTHVHWVDDAIQPTHPLLSPSPLALNLSQHQGLFQWVSSSHQVTKVCRFSISPSNEYSWLISSRIGWFGLLSVQGTLGVFPSTTVQKHQFFSVLPLWSNSRPYVTTEKPELWLDGPLSAKWCLFLICYLALIC